MDVIQFLDKLIALEDKALIIKPRVQGTLDEAVRIADAAAGAGTGHETESAVLLRIASAIRKARELVG